MDSDLETLLLSHRQEFSPAQIETGLPSQANMLTQ